jgi:hypothetical protein
MISAAVPAYAESFSDISEEPVLEHAVDILSSYKIMDGYPGGIFKPDKIVTRAEMAKIITVASGYYEYSKSMTTSYEDMQGHWAESYVELAQSLNIVKGVSKTKFGPDYFIKFTEAYTMILRMLGYTDEALGGDWPINYYNKAVELNLFEGMENPGEFATRRDISIMIYNALKLNLVKTRDDNSIYKTDKTLLSLVGSMETKEITMDYLKDESFDYSSYVFNKWDIYYDKSKNIVKVDNPRYKSFKGTVTSILSNRVIFAADNNGNIKVFRFTSTPIVFNGAVGYYNSLLNSKVNIVYSDESGEIYAKGVVATKPTQIILADRLNMYRSGSTEYLGQELPTKEDGSVNYERIHVFGDASSLYEIKDDDLIYIYETNEYTKSVVYFEVLRSQVHGIVTGSETANYVSYVTVNGTAYTTGQNYLYTEPASVNDEVNLILDKNNHIAKINILNYGKAPSTFGVVMTSSSGINANPSVKILNEYGNVKTYELAENSGVVSATVNGSNSNVLYSTSLGKNDIVMFDPVSSGTLKIIDYMKPTYYTGNYYSSSGTLSNGFKITDDTFIVYESGGKYRLLQPIELDSYITGNIVVNYYGHVDAMLITNGIKTNSYVTPTENVSQSFSGTVYSMIRSINKIDDTTSQVEFFNNSNVFSVSNSSSAGKQIVYLKNSFVKAAITNGNIAGISSVAAETGKIKITAVYSNQLQIDGITYMEYSSGVKIYHCGFDSAGNVSGFTAGSLSDIKAGSYAQLYDIYGSFDGIVDVVILYN